jgi:hypothetical protein
MNGGEPFPLALFTPNKSFPNIGNGLFYSTFEKLGMSKSELPDMLRVSDGGLIIEASASTRTDVSAKWTIKTDLIDCVFLVLTYRSYEPRAS